MKLTKLLIASSLLAVSLSANDVMQKSMSVMEKGMTQNKVMIYSLIKKVISSYLPENKKHMANVAANASTRITLALNVLEVNLDDKAYVNAANAYSDMLNACSSCHSIVRNW